MSDPILPEGIKTHDFGPGQETQQMRNARKLMMSIGDANGMPDSRVIRRLARLIPKQLKIDGEIPKPVLEFIETFDLEDEIANASKELEVSDDSIDRRRRAAMERDKEMRSDTLDRKAGSSDDG